MRLGTCTWCNNPVTTEQNVMVDMGMYFHMKCWDKFGGRPETVKGK